MVCKYCMKDLELTKGGVLPSAEDVQAVLMSRDCECLE